MFENKGNILILVKLLRIYVIYVLIYVNESECQAPFISDNIEDLYLEFEIVYGSIYF